MNSTQRTVLVLGILALIIAYSTAIHLPYAHQKPHFLNVDWLNWQEAVIRCGAVIAVTTAIFFMVGKRK